MGRRWRTGRAARALGQREQRALRLVVGQGDERLERARELDHLELGRFGRQPAGPSHSGCVEALLVLGVEDEQDGQGVAEGDVGRSAAVAWMRARLPLRMARWKRE